MTLTRHPRERRFVVSTWRQPGISTALALCLLVIALAACQPAVQQPDLVGVWIDRDRFTVMQFDTDGIWIIAMKFERLSTSPFSFGPYHLEGTLLTFETDEESVFCGGATGTYEVELSEQEELTFMLVDDSSCDPRGQDITRSPFKRYSP
ncbi:MAG: hypothetical protein O6949_09445 [Chloroflexi bacterium]|nr:hypothetical protein [Chloroflexota bacterium]